VTVERRIADALFPPPAYAHVAVAHGRLVCTAGAVPVNAEGELVGSGDIAAQTRQVIDNLLVQLAAGGADADDIVKTTVFVVADDPAPLSAAWNVVRESPLAGAPSTLLGVTALGYSGQLVEIEAVAVLD
jgi:enamine deaminase RidA (YjgF/YER057c/UK114 family)